MTTNHSENRHLNTMIPDHNSEVTGFGIHDRVVAFCPDGDDLYCRVDHLWNLGMPTEKQILTAAKKRNGTSGKWILSKVEQWENGKSTDFHFAKV